VPILKVLGPIRNFVIENETCLKWLDKDFYSVRSTGDQVDFQVSISADVTCNVKFKGNGPRDINPSGYFEICLQIILTHGRDTLSFAGYNYYILSKPKDMPTVGNVTINRAAHEGKASAFPEQSLTIVR
jgi:hypothetical protein